MALTPEEIRMLRLPPQMIPFAGDPNSPPTAGVTIAMPKLDSPFVQTDDLTTSIPWYLLVINLWRLAQPTGVTPGTYLGFTVNAYGQITGVQTSGITITSPIITDPTINNPTINNATINNVVINGAATAPTAAPSDNSNTIATTAFVHSQGYATQTFVLSQGFATETFVMTRGFITDAPADGNRYCRQNGVWVAF